MIGIRAHEHGRPDLHARLGCTGLAVASNKERSPAFLLDARADEVDQPPGVAAVELEEVRALEAGLPNAAIPARLSVAQGDVQLVDGARFLDAGVRVRISPWAPSCRRLRLSGTVQAGGYLPGRVTFESDAAITIELVDWIVERPLVRRTIQLKAAKVSESIPIEYERTRPMGIRVRGKDQFLALGHGETWAVKIDAEGIEAREQSSR